jgi:radical SAM superfamily enzyme YgiQ (UPF0313 family)
MMRVLLSVLPSFQNSSFLVAHLGNACISAYLKKYIPDISVETFDLRVAPEVKEIWGPANLPQITFKNLFVSDIYDLPLIASVIKQFQQGKSIKSILEPDAEVASRWSLEHSIYPQTVIEKLRKTNFFAMKYLKRFEGYDVVGFSLYTTNLYLSVFMALLIRLQYPQTKIVFGGPQVTQGETSRELLLKGGIADFLVLGEGEQPMLEAVKALLAGTEIEQITGIKTLKNFSSPDTFSQTANLEDLPVPDYQGTDFEAFNPFVIPVYSNRGCPFRCHFCSEHSLFGKKFKRRSPQKVIDDMKVLYARHGIDQFTIADSLINSSEEWLEEFTDLLLNTAEKFYWGGYFRAELAGELVKKMKKAGLVSAILGVESFSQQTLNSMNKRKVRQEIIDTIHFLVENEIHAFVNLFVGYPGESEADFLSTYEISNELYEEFDKLNKSEYFRITARNFQLRPFSNVYNAYEKFGLEAESWGKYYSEVHFPVDFKNIFDKTLCSFKVKNVSLEDTLQRINMMRQIREKTLTHLKGPL